MLTVELSPMRLRPNNVRKGPFAMPLALDAPNAKDDHSWTRNAVSHWAGSHGIPVHDRGTGDFAACRMSESTRSESCCALVPGRRSNEGGNMQGDGDGRIIQWCDGHGVTGHGLLCTISTVRLSLRCCFRDIKFDHYYIVCTQK